MTHAENIRSLQDDVTNEYVESYMAGLETQVNQLTMERQSLADQLAVALSDDETDETKIEQLTARLAEQDALVVQLKKRIAELEPPPEPAGGMLVGANEGRIPELENALNGPEIQVRRAYDISIDDVLTTISQDKAAGRSMAFPSFKAWPTNPDELKRLAGSIEFPTCLTYEHEEDNGPKVPIPTYKQRMNDLYDAVEDAGNPYVKVGPLLTGDPWRTKNASGVLNALQYMPDRMHANFVDIYRYARDPGDIADPTLGYPPLRSAGWLLGEEKDDGSPKPGGGIVTWSTQRDVPIAIGEFNAHPFKSNKQNRPNWYRDTFAYLRNVPCGCLAACIFHSPFGAHGPWLVHKFPVYTTDERDAARLGGDSDPDSLAAFKAELVAAIG